MMPKFVLFLTLCVSLVSYHFLTLCNPRLEVLGSGYVKIFSRERVTTNLATKQYLATGFMYRARSHNAAALRAKFTQIDGESIVLDNYKPAHQILAILGHHTVGTQITAQTQITYAFSNRHQSFITSNQTRINLQIASRDGRVTIGWPVILGSY